MDGPGIALWMSVLDNGVGIKAIYNIILLFHPHFFDASNSLRGICFANVGGGLGRSRPSQPALALTEG